MKKIEIRLYGRLGEAGLGEKALIDLTEGMKVSDILAALSEALGGRRDVLKGCVIASETEVLSPSAPVPGESSLAALPPVCGG